MKKNLLYFAIVILLLPTVSKANSLGEKLKGKILLQVESEGEAWYIDSENYSRYYLGRPEDAFSIMRNKGLGIKHSELTNYLEEKFPKKFSGMIFLDVEKNGEAYYVFPDDLNGYYLGRPNDAFEIMRQLGLGISNKDIDSIEINCVPHITNSEKKYKVIGSCIYFENNLAPDIISSSFVDLGFYYAKDNEAIFHWGNRKWDIDYESFRVINHYAFDKNNYYYYGEKIEDVDYQTFSPASTIIELGLSDQYAIDKNGVYFGKIRILRADKDTFKAVKWDYAFDKSFFYNRDELYKIKTGWYPDEWYPDFIEVLADGYYKFDGKVYYQGQFLDNYNKDGFYFKEGRATINGVEYDF